MAEAPTGHRYHWAVRGTSQDESTMGSRARHLGPARLEQLGRAGQAMGQVGQGRQVSEGWCQGSAWKWLEYHKESEKGNKEKMGSCHRLPVV